MFVNLHEGLVGLGGGGGVEWPEFLIMCTFKLHARVCNFDGLSWDNRLVSPFLRPRSHYYMLVTAYTPI